MTSRCSNGSIGPCLGRQLTAQGGNPMPMFVMLASKLQLPRYTMSHQQFHVGVRSMEVWGAQILHSLRGTIHHA